MYPIPDAVVKTLQHPSYILATLLSSRSLSIPGWLLPSIMPLSIAHCTKRAHLDWGRHHTRSLTHSVDRLPPDRQTDTQRHAGDASSNSILLPPALGSPLAEKVVDVVLQIPDEVEGSAAPAAAAPAVLRHGRRWRRLLLLLLLLLPL